MHTIKIQPQIARRLNGRKKDSKKMLECLVYSTRIKKLNLSYYITNTYELQGKGTMAENNNKSRVIQ